MYSSGDYVSGGAVLYALWPSENGLLRPGVVGEVLLGEFMLGVDILGEVIFVGVNLGVDILGVVRVRVEVNILRARIL